MIDKIFLYTYQYKLINSIVTNINNKYISFLKKIIKNHFFI